MKKRLFVNIKTKLGSYRCLFESNYPEKGYTVTVPKLIGVVSCGDTLREAQKMIKEAIELHCECLFERGLAEVKLLKKIAAKISVHA